MMKKSALFRLFALPLLLGCTPVSTPRSSFDPGAESEMTRGNYRGWDYLVERLRRDGVPEAELRAVYGNARLPAFDFIPFKIAPKESPDIYHGFLRRSYIEKARHYLEANEETLNQASRAFRVKPEVIVAILLVETQFGKNLGRHMIVERLSRVASVGEPGNLRKNFEKLKREDYGVQWEDVVKRAHYLEQTFYPEVLATFEIARREKISPFVILGSIAGAFGQPQFLPSSYLKFGVDGNGDGVVTLYDRQDAIFSVAKYLASNGWSDYGTIEEQSKVIWSYNRSEPYIDTILRITEALERGR